MKVENVEIPSSSHLPLSSSTPMALGTMLGIQMKMSPPSPKCSLDPLCVRTWGLTHSGIPASQKGECSGLSVSWLRDG